MSFRFYRRTHLFPGVGVNLSRSGPSLSLGLRGAHVTLGRRGITRTVGIPGSGLYWTSRTGRSTGFHSAHVTGPVSPALQRTDHALAAVLVVAIVAAGLALVAWICRLAA